MSPGAPAQAAGRGVEGADWSLFLAGLFLVDSGRTGADGKIRVSLIPTLSYTLNVLGTNYSVSLDTNAMDGLTTLTGQQQRLRALGYHIGNSGATADGVDGAMSVAVDRSILAFQSDQGLTADGNVGPVTRGKLKAAVDDRPRP